MPDFDKLHSDLTGIGETTAHMLRGEPEVHVPAGVVVPPSPIEQQLKGQLRIFVAAIAGAIVTAAANKLNLPILTTLWGVQGEQIVGAIVGLLMFAGMAVWSWMRAKITHTKLASIAMDKRVPDEVAKMG